LDGQQSKEGLQSILEAIEEERGMTSSTQYDDGRPIEEEEQQQDEAVMEIVTREPVQAIDGDGIGDKETKVMQLEARIKYFKKHKDQLAEEQQ